MSLPINLHYQLEKYSIYFIFDYFLTSITTAAITTVPADITPKLHWETPQGWTIIDDFAISSVIFLMGD